jgi:hypothetical protein
MSELLEYEAPERLLTETEVAKIDNVSVAKLRKDRQRGVGIEYIRHGRLVFYTMRAILKHRRRNTVRTNSASNDHQTA